MSTDGGDESKLENKEENKTEKKDKQKEPKESPKTKLNDLLMSISKVRVSFYLATVLRCFCKSFGTNEEIEKSETSTT